MPRTGCVLIALASMFATSAQAVNDFRETLRRRPAALVCDFEILGSGTFREGEFEKGDSKGHRTMTFAAIDAEKKTAQIIDEHSADPVSVFGGGILLTFFEDTPIGGHATITSVLLIGSDDDEGPRTPGPFPAVHSRHTATLDGEFLIAQYHGMCEPKY
jgi:hypothetical protein